ncbi:unnamed protein product [Euphydryas editha]|uniref:Uncharacterized protein n=1 Tax=Euphydryas editha TaxID=104508 RepID=A0AAU9U4J7_EUPED|nr:unnamed protein product [Euphydryas editha]
MAKKRLSDTAIAQFLEIPSESEDGQDSSEAESDDDLAKLRQNLNQVHDVSSDSLIDPLPNIDIACTVKVNEQPSEPQPCTSRSVNTLRSNRSSITFTVQRTAVSTKTTVTKRKKRNLIWKKKSLQTNHPDFTGNTN